MQATDVARCIALLGALALGCSRKSAEPTVIDDTGRHFYESRNWYALYTRAPGDVPMHLKGSRFEVRSFGYDCDVDVSWASLDPPLQFRAAISAVEGQVFPLRDGLEELIATAGITYPKGGNAIRAYANVGDPVSSTLPVLAAGDVFIPLDGYASLDGVYATGNFHFASPDSPFTWVNLTVEDGSLTEHADVYSHLLEGDVFRWAGRDARVVRLVRVNVPCCMPTGWVEVRLGGSRDGGA